MKVSTINWWQQAIAVAVALTTAQVWGAATPVGGRAGTATAEKFISLPLSFEANQGQTSPEIRFLARGRGYTFFVMSWGAEMLFTRSQPAAARPVGGVLPAVSPAGETRAIAMRFVGANPTPVVSGQGDLPGHINYFIGNDPAQWHPGVSLHQRVQVKEVYPGADVVFHGAQQKLEYDFIFAPKADPAQVIIEFSGADQVEIDPHGDLVLRVGTEEIRQHRPVLYQTIRGVRREITGGYRLAAPNRVGFVVGDYDPTQILVIDPVVNYATYLGGAGLDTAWQIAIDGSGSAYLAGETTSAGLPTSPGAFQTNYAGGSTNGGDVFVAKLNPEATALTYLTYIGGKGNDGALALAVDTNGNAYLTGYTDSTNYPTVNALNPKIGGKVDKVTGFPPSDTFVTKLNSNGSQLVYSTYLGGSSFDQGLGIAVDAGGSAYVAGFTDSTDFPVAQSVQTSNRGGRDGYLTALNATGSGYLFSTYLGGTNTDFASGVTVDPSGMVYVCGYTTSTNFPVTNAFQANLNQETNVQGFAVFDAFLAKFFPGGTQMVYCTFLGGEADDYSYRVAADAAGNAYLAGWGSSASFPPTNATSFLVLTNAETNVTVKTDAFVAKVGSTGALLNTARFGGIGLDEAIDLKLDPSGNMYVAGFTSSPLIPIVGASSAQNQANRGLSDAFVFALSADFSTLRYSLMFGGSVNDYGFGLAVDAAGNAYVVGKTSSADFPTTGVLQPVFAGGISDAFVARILLEPLLTLQQSGTNVVLSWPAPAPGFRAQTRNTLDSELWLNLLPTPALSNGNYFITVPLSNEPALFRLFRP